ncbi:hypothetical protein KW787_00275 [Candidatus Pacearchaeota archaeon]|nr:hypothetical protein [Candidatus Pacearchaeota archaeon]
MKYQFDLDIQQGFHKGEKIQVFANGKKIFDDKLGNPSKDFTKHIGKIEVEKNYVKIEVNAVDRKMKRLFEVNVAEFPYIGIGFDADMIYLRQQKKTFIYE